MWRTLRAKLTLLVIVGGFALLTFSTFLTLTFSIRALDRQTGEYADLLARQSVHHVQTLWRFLKREDFGEEIRPLTEGQDNGATIDVFFFDTPTNDEVNSHPSPPLLPLSSAERQDVLAGHKRVSELSLGDTPWVQVLTPLQEDGRVVGAVRVRTSVDGLRRLQQEEVYSTVLLAVIFSFGVFLLLRMFLHRQVNEPIEQLTSRMAEAEAGNLQTRVALWREDEIGQLGAHFNRMLTRLERSDTENHALLTRMQHFNEELETRVHQATHELVERNQELLRLQREMDRVEPLAALGRVTGAIAHELGTPLNTILGYSQLLLRDHPSATTHEHVSIIETQARRMADIIRHYLSRTRDAARQYRQVDLNTIVRETLAVLAPMFVQHRVTVASTLDESLPFLTGDSASLQRVLINLLNNAVEAIEGGGTVSVLTRPGSSPETPKSGIVLTITDTGTGIPPELLSQVFDLFVTTKTPGKGTGLGLALCQEIIKAHGGTITVTSEVGKGTSVNIFLPVITSASAADRV